MYARLANIIVKHHKLIIVLWIVALFYTFPLIFKINDVIVYSESNTGLGNLESMKAQELIDRYFVGEIAPSMITIVIKDDALTILDTHVRDFTKSLADNASVDGGMRGVLSIDYMWGSIAQYYGQIAHQSGPALYGLYHQANQSASLLYQTPTTISFMHWSYYYAYNGTLDDTTIRSLVLSNIENAAIASGADAATVALTMGYANAFYDVWLPSKPVYTDYTALQPMIDAAVAAYFTPMGETGAFFVALNQGIGISAYNSGYYQLNGRWYLQSVAAFAVVSFSQQAGLNSSFIQAVWDLGPTPSVAESVALANSIVFNPETTFDKLPGVPSFLVEPFVNVHPDSGPANNTMLMVVSLSVNGSSSEADGDVRVLRTLISQRMSLLEPPGMSGQGIAVYVSGDPALNVDIMDAVNKDTSRIEPVTIILVVLLVGLYFRSGVTPWVPLMTVGMAYLLSTAFIYLLGTYVMSIHYSVMTIVLTVIMGAGTDYCIFIMSRYREERVAGRPKEEAMSTSLMWAGESITTSGATVMIGFGALMIATYSLVKSMGMALVLAVGMALLFALTMLPSLLMLIGDRVFWPNTMEQAVARRQRIEASGGGYFRKSARIALSKRRAIVLAALLISVPALYLFISLESSYDFIAGLPKAESRLGLDAMSAGFGSGKILPTYILVGFPQEVVVNGSLTPQAAADLEEYCQQVDAIDNVRGVEGPTRPFGTPVNESYLENLTQDQKASYELAVRNSLGTDNRTIMLTVVFQDQPFTTNSIHTIDHIRQADRTTGDFPSGTEILVGGSTAGMADVSRTVSNDFITMRFIVVVGIFIVLMIVMGSLLVPARLVLTVLMNVIWTIAMTMIVFQYVNGVPVLWMVPLILFVVAMGLGMDYDIFLTTRIREEVSKGKTDEQAILTAVERTGGIITACGLVMAGAFGSMMLSSTALLREFGFALAFSILLDAMIIRIYLVPAIMLMLQKWNWYAPGRLQRVRRGERARKH